MNEKKFLETFSKNNLKTLKSKLEEKNIHLPDNYTFSNFNIVIGSNGSGKTRFLNAICDFYHKIRKKNTVVYGFFPSLSSKKYSNNDIINEKSQQYALTDKLLDNNIEFEDILKEIELNNENYINKLLEKSTRLINELNANALKNLIENYKIISSSDGSYNDGQEIIVEDNSIKIKFKDGRVEDLQNALNLFSPGELMIFYISILLSLHNKKNTNQVLIIDEPECHLHPKSLLAFIKILKESNLFSSIWIATHSLFLIPEFEFDEIIYIDKNKIVPRSSQLYKNILTDLLGKDNENIVNFFSSLSQWEFCEYIAQCFSEPTIVKKVNSEDEQVKLFLRHVQDIKRIRNIRILDFGGGSARLGKSIDKLGLLDKIDYDLYDKNPQYNGNKFQVYKSIDSMSQKYDCVVLMNVLHEIEPKEWVDLFAKIYNLLVDKGTLLFIETAVLSKGESPTKTGFLVLGAEELKALFQCDFQLKPIIIKENQKSICIPIKKELLKNVTLESVNNAISTLESNTFNKIEKIRKADDYIYPRYYAFLSQLYVNAKIYNSSIEKALPKSCVSAL